MVSRALGAIPFAWQNCQSDHVVHSSMSKDGRDWRCSPKLRASLLMALQLLLGRSESRIVVGGTIAPDGADLSGNRDRKRKKAAKRRGS